MANQNILFYKSHAHEHRERLRNWFPYILGAETAEVLNARQRISVLERKLNQLKKEITKENFVSNKWKMNIFGYLKTAVDYGLIADDFSSEDDSEILIDAAKELLENIPNSPKISQDIIKSSNAKIEEFDKISNDLALKIGEIKKRLRDILKLKIGFTGYGSVAKKRVERLHISKWISDIAIQSNSCPVCGENKHAEAFGELNNISKALRIYESESTKHSEIPTSFDREENRLKGDLDLLLEKQSASQKRYDMLISKDKVAKKEFFKRKEMYIFIGHLKASLERFDKLVEDGDLEKELKILQDEYDDLKPLVNEYKIKKKVDAATSEISAIILTYLKKMDVEDKYRLRAPQFNVKELAIKVMGK